MRRLLFLDHAPIVGGAQLALAEHLRQLDRSRFEPHVACGQAMPEFVAALSSTGAVIHSFDWPRLRGLTPRRAVGVGRAALRLRRLVREQRIDVVVANTSRTAYLAAVALAGLRRPVVWWVRDFDFGRRLFRLLHSRADRVICVSQAIRQFYGGAQDPRFVVVPVGSGIHARLSDCPPEQIRAARERLGFEPDAIVVGYMGRLVEGKGPADLVAAVERLAPDMPRLRLVIVGTGAGQEGNVEPRLRAHVRDRGLENVIRFAGFQSDEALYYQLFDIFVLSSRYREAMPTSVIQAMMARRPVIATNTGGTPEVVVDGATGIVIPPNDASALAGAIRRLVSDRELARQYVDAAAAHVDAHHRESTVTRRVEAIYESLPGT